MNKFLVVLREISFVVLSVLRVVLIAACLSIFLAGLLTHLRFSGRILTFGCLLVAISLVPLNSRRWSFLSGITGALLFCLSIIVCFSSQSPSAKNIFTTEPYGSHVRYFLGSLIQEEDGFSLALPGLSLIGAITSHENIGLKVKLRSEYENMRKRIGDFPTPLVASYLGAQTESSFDLISLSSGSNSKKAIIFLHGFGGNWSLLCAIFSEIVSPNGFDVFCPTVGPIGLWKEEQGKITIDRTLKMLEDKGYRDIYLAGLSNGAVGVSVHSDYFKQRLKGLILLFGIHSGVAKAELPTLVVFGSQDERFEPMVVREIAKRQTWLPDLLTMTEVEGDHFAILKEKWRVSKAIQDWFGKGRTKNLVPGNIF